LAKALRLSFCLKRKRNAHEDDVMRWRSGCSHDGAQSAEVLVLPQQLIGLQASSRFDEYES